MDIEMQEAAPGDADTIALMAKSLLEEIMGATGGKHFNIDLPEMSRRCKRFLEDDIYVVFKALDTESEALTGFISLCESHSLYAEGSFGIIQELYVDKGYREHGIGAMLVNRAMEHGTGRGWKRLEVATPPLPHFDRTVKFYERQNFEVTGGKKMRVIL